MASRQTIPYSFGTFFITFTCYQWLPLIEKADGYDIIYKWFDHLKDHGHFINSYVIMPDHVHALISFVETGQSINTVIGNGKRFMAYEIIKRLKQNDEKELLKKLADEVEETRKQNNKLHQVWELSFDWKDCRTNKFINQKLDYIHSNPCRGKWNLCNSPDEYLHSSAKFYLTGEQGIYPVTNVGEMEDVVFTKKGSI
ncbi:MAG: transposase [Bacteroidia bacterium]|nr:transposase [Bacteroidia bacterium]